MKSLNLLNLSRRAIWCAVFAFCASFWLGAFGLTLIVIAEWANK